jgi:hypothetical protein
MEAIAAAPLSSYSYTDEFETSIPTENVRNTQNLTSASFTLHRKAAKRTFPWELRAEEIISLLHRKMNISKRGSKRPRVEEHFLAPTDEATMYTY